MTQMIVKYKLQTEAIDMDLVDSFNEALDSDENYREDGSINWDFVESDMIMNPLNTGYTVGEIVDALYLLADIFDEEVGKLAA